MVSQQRPHEDNKRLLSKMLSAPSAQVPHIHLYGTSACGILEALKLLENTLPETLMVFVNCLSVEGCTKELLSRISKAFKLKHSKCDNVCSLQHDVDAMIKESGKRLVCVLLEAHVLTAFTSSFLSALFDISRQINDDRFSFVTASHLPWMYFQREVNSCGPEPISFPFLIPPEGVIHMYKTDVIIENISRRLEIPSNFVKNCMNHLIPTTNNPTILANLISETWKNIDKTEWNNAIGLKQYLKYLDGIVYDRNIWMDSSFSLVNPAAKLVVVAAFCASHNYPASDKRYLIKTHNKEKVRVNQKTSESKGVVKMFDLERLLFVREAFALLYPHLSQDMAGIEPKLLVNSLISMNRLVMTSSKENIDWPKLKCVTPFETIRQLSQTISINDINIHLEQDNS
ncbi:hypothetical protein PFISCL1PPCAC_15562 [Pristionchus fissidentatus]|uniref:Origin recognition complex subunit 5 C-terminal domain-containing protein n=1 Tax=Pristionchus fissidentatus TaxID=1538716 RepID=A0AAV5W0L2_9BILA|nr:hypothetical protein PFISCL1PPCAC_15562 [Pristionchus fissidentatus]